MRKWGIVSIAILCLTLMTGCAFGKGLWYGITGQDLESTKVANEVITKAGEIAKESNAKDILVGAEKLAQDLKEGKLDVFALNKFLSEVGASVKNSKENVTELATLVKDYTNKNENEKPNPLETLGSFIGVAMATYLGTRKVRNTKLGNKIGGALDFILTLGGKAEPKPNLIKPT